MTEEQIMKAAGVVAFSITLAVAGYLTNVFEDDAVKFVPKKFGTTVLVGVVTGVIVYQSGDAASPEVIISASASAVYVVDRVLNVVMDEPPEAEPIHQV
jgi:NhaP-type Na+/H+ or K+/H+ antiporter